MTPTLAECRDHELRGLAVIDFCKEENEIEISPDMLRNVKVRSIIVLLVRLLKVDAFSWNLLSCFLSPKLASVNTVWTTAGIAGSAGIQSL